MVSFSRVLSKVAVAGGTSAVLSGLNHNIYQWKNYFLPVTKCAFLHMTQANADFPFLEPTLVYARYIFLFAHLLKVHQEKNHEKKSKSQDPCGNCIYAM